MDLSSLPYDALLRILQHLAYDELHILGLSCRRLNLLAFNVIIKRHQYSENLSTSSTCFRLNLPKDLIILSVLRLSFFTPFPSSLKKLYLQFSHESKDMSALSNDFRQVLNLLTLKPTMPFMAVLRHIETMAVRTKLNVRIDPKEFFKAVLSTCGSCKRVTLSNSVDFYSYYYRVPLLPYRDRSRYRDIILERQPPKSGRSLSWTNRMKQPQFTFRRITIVKPQYLLSDQFAQVIRDDLPNVRELSLPKMPRLWGPAWSGILSGLASAVSLRRVTLDPTGIAPYDLLQILAKLPKLETLNILPQDRSKRHGDYDLWHAYETTPEKRVKFRSLRCLYLSPSHAAIILGQRLPRLSSMEINVQGGTLFNTPSRKAFTMIASLLKDHKRPIKVSLKVAFPYKPGTILDMVRDLDGYFLTGLGKDETGQNPLSVFSDLSVEKIKTLRNADHGFFIQTLTQWLRLFTALRHASFTTYHSSRTNVVWKVYPLIRTIHVHCPTIQSVTLSTIKYDVPTFLLEGDGIIPRRPSKVGATTIGDLDRDVFHHIFQYLGTKELYPLSCLCRNLREWVLPLYLRRRGLDLSTADFDVHLVQTRITHKQADILTDISALTLSSLEKMRSLSIRIDRDVNLHLLFEFLHRILRLVRKCSTLGAVTLNLASIRNGSPQSTMDGYITERSRNVWTELAFVILCALVERSESLIVLGQGVLGRVASLARLDCNSDQGRLQYMAKSPIKHALSKLELDSESLKLPVISQSLMAELQKSGTVMYVNITKVTSLVSSSLRTIAISLPKITHLKLSGSQILPEDILSVVYLLSLLQDLRISGCHSHRDAEGRLRSTEVTGPVQDLPHLQFLSAPQKYIDFLLDNGNKLQSLVHVTIELPHDNSTSPPSPEFDPIVNLQHLSETVCRVKARHNSPSLGLDTFLSIIADLKPEQVTDAGWELVARSTEKITLGQFVGSTHLDGWRTPADTALSLQRWLKLFPALRTLEFTGITDSRRLECVIQSPLLLDTIRGLQAVFVNGVPHNLSQLSHVF